MRILAVTILLLATLRLYAWDGFFSPGYAYGAAAYLDRPAHAYSAALGKSVTAWTDGLAGVQYNPAILDAGQYIQLTSSYTFLTDDRKFVVFDGVIPIGTYFVVGAGFRRLGMDSLEQRDEYGFQKGYFDDQEIAADLAVAGRIIYNVSVAIRARYLNQMYKGLKENDNGNASGIGFDAGAIWQPDSHVCIGVSGLNIGSYIWWGTGQRDIVLPQARLGIAGILLKRSLIVEADIVKTLYQPIDVSLGLQYTLFGIISARVGALTSVDIESRHSSNPVISFGMGMRYSFFGCDYSITIPPDNSHSMISHQVSLILQIKPL